MRKRRGEKARQPGRPCRRSAALHRHHRPDRRCPDGSGIRRFLHALQPPRGLPGGALRPGGAGQLEIPPDKRFYAGGSATVRGYKYQSIGLRFATNRPAGGTAVVAGTVEFWQRFLEDYGAVAFVDGGQVSADGPPFTGTTGVGVGVGARYYTVIGPIRLDVAVPLQRRPGTGSFELYIGIGQAF